jgi:Icc protein
MKKHARAGYRLAWITDPHLNFLPRGFGPHQFGQHVEEDFDTDGIVITGDISECPVLEEQLESFWAGAKKKDLYFVLGNHDYYNGSFRIAEIIARNLTGKGIIWLSESDPIPLTKTSCLVGQEGFYDALVGKKTATKLIMNDFLLIEEFEPRVFGHVLNEDPKHKFKIMREKSLKEADLAYAKLTLAAKSYRNVYFGTHYPPFVDACWHEGKVSDDTWSPYFTSKLMGDALLKAAKENPDTNFNVLCGHTHSDGYYKASANLRVETGSSEYRSPRVHRVIEIP